MAIEQETNDAQTSLEKQELPSELIIQDEQHNPTISEEEPPSSPIPSNDTRPATLSQDILTALTLHNSLRRSRNIAPLNYDKSLQDSARQWAEHLAKNVGKLEHATDIDQGENIYWASGGGFEKEPCANATRSWLNEGRWYTGQRVGDPAQGVIGHFTQCMWSGTRRVGMAAVEGGNGDGKRGVYVVARYEPGGNFVGERPY
ncbi:CAP domain-containing protein [Cercophora samala]|uniref:CAP domain-containing protein n=1 Tax=Cercophora samala TaxID=330535 RepID=A0AA39ZA31_9PEZI|nr:CAP domain-containing protein [Cercophora samala]